jgi:hypothetical protein
MVSLAAVKAHGPVILNVLRAINVVGLLAAAIACIIVVIKTGVRDPSGWWFFDTVSYVFTCLACIFLIGSEFPVIPAIRGYYESNWPLLSHHHGLSWLAVAMIMISFKLLGSLYNPSRVIDGPFRSVVLAGGCMIFASAILTVVLSFFFSDRTNNVNARTLRSRRAAEAAGSVIDASSIRSHTRMLQTDSSFGEKSGFLGAVTGLLGKKKNNNLGGAVAKRNISSPMNSTRSRPSPGSGRGSMEDEEESPRPNSNDRRSPLNPEIERPATAMHPYFHKIPRYSEASFPRDFI